MAVLTSARLLIGIPNRCKIVRSSSAGLWKYLLCSVRINRILSSVVPSTSVCRVCDNGSVRSPDKGAICNSRSAASSAASCGCWLSGWLFPYSTMSQSGLVESFGVYRSAFIPSRT